MITISVFFFLLMATFLSQLSLSSSTPVQVDLIFPRNNTVYQPVYPFPFVFAIHNFSSAWEYRPSVHWRLRRFNPKNHDIYDIQDGFIGWEPEKTQPTWAPPPDRFLAINASEAPSLDIIEGSIRHIPNPSNQTNWMLEYSISFGLPNCLERKERVKRIFFNSSINFGVMPNLEAFGSCPQDSAAISIESKTQMNETCVGLTPTQPGPVPCAFAVDQQTLDQVSKEMVKVSQCANVTWPNGTGIGTQCSPPGKVLSSEGNFLRGKFSAMGFSVIILIVISILA